MERVKARRTSWWSLSIEAPSFFTAAENQYRYRYRYSPEHARPRYCFSLGSFI